MIHIPQLDSVIAQIGCDIKKPLHPVCEHMEVTEIFFSEKTVFVFFQFLAEIDQLLIVDAQFTDIPADLADPVHIGTFGILQDFCFKAGQFPFIFFHQVQIFMHD